VSRMRRPSALPLLVLLLLLAFPATGHAATCSDYSNQAAAQRAVDTRDADGDGIYCESLPCPCSKAQGGGGGDNAGPPAPPKRSCVKPDAVQNISFSKTKYPNIRRHMLRAIRKGWPRVMVLNRRGTNARRDRLLAGYPTRDGYDRDEYPASFGRGSTFRWLMRGSDPTGWRASVMYVPSSENRSHGSVLGIKLRRFCDGTRFRYVFY